MTAGQPYKQFDAELIARRTKIRHELITINQLDNNDQRNQRIQQLFADTSDHFFL